MPDQPHLPPVFHEGCYCFRDTEAEAARASGQPVRCGGGQPCACVDPEAPPYESMWDNILGDILPGTSGGSKRSRSQCASCSCACAILHAASAAATAAAAKIRRCCGGDCRCPAGLCRCPQEAVPVDTYACGALNEAISQRVATALQMEPTPSVDVSAALQGLQPPQTMSSVEIANALNAALQGIPSAPTLQQTMPVQTSRTPCCASSDIPQQRQQLSDDLTNGLPPLPTPPRSCCGNASSRPPPFTNCDISVSTGITNTDFETALPSLQTLTQARASGCCGGSSSSPMVQPSGVSEIITTGQCNGEASRHSVRQAGCTGGSSSSPVIQPVIQSVCASDLITTTHNSESSRYSPRSVPAKGSARAKSFPGSAPSSRSEPVQKSGERDRIFACNICDAAFKFKQNRDRHINEVHRGLRPHECDYPGCQSAFKNLSGLKQHKKTVHEKARPFKCLLCDRAFGQRNHLSQHILVVHEKVKRYACSFCDMAFSNVGNRTQHTKRRHPNELQRKENELQRKENEPKQLNESAT